MKRPMRMMIARMLGPAVLLALVVALYHWGGLHFMFWADSQDYMTQAESLWGGGPYQRPSARSVGYPLFLAGVFTLSYSALALIAAQALLVVFAYVAIYRHFGQALVDHGLDPARKDARLGACVQILLVATASYSALQVFILSLLPEIVHAVSALFSVLAVSWLVRRSPHSSLWWPAAIAAAMAAVPVLIKPHWLLAAAVLAGVVAAKLTLSQHAGRHALPAATLRLAAALLFPFVVAAAVLVPDARLAATSPRAELFGPRTLFCNHLHYIGDVLKGERPWQLAPDPGRDARLKAAARTVLETAPKPWQHLGFDGDHCMYNAAFLSAVSAELPAPDDERAFYMAGYRAAVLGNPVRFAGKVLRQIVLGLERSFAKFDYHLSSSTKHALPHEFFAGTSLDGDAGPMRSKQRLNATVPGRVVQGLLAISFIAQTTALCGLILLTVVFAPLRFSSWTGERQRHFMAYVGVPILALAAHHGLIGISHSFDVWRYAFGTFFVSISFVVTAALFWAHESARLRALLQQAAVAKHA